MLETFTADSFAVGDRLSAKPAGHDPLELEVVEVSEVAGDASRRQPFSLVFRGPAEPVLEQGTFAVEHPSIGDFALFLVPIGPDEAGMRYEAVFT